MNTFRADTETYPIRPGLLAPKLVCLQYAMDRDGPTPTDGQIQIVLANQAEDVLVAALESDCLLEWHNGAFDQVVTCAAFPHLVPKWFRALGTGRGRDTYLREQLIEIRNGTLQDKHPKGGFSLGGVARRRCRLDLDKSEDSWRLRYALLDGRPVVDWPAEARQYAIEDVSGLRAVSRSQLADFVPEDEWLQVAAAFCLQLAASWGVRTDPERAEWVEVALMTSAEEAAQLLTDAGLFSDGSVKRDKVIAAVERACAKAGRQVPKTNPSKKFPNGQTKADAETCEDLAPYDPVLTELSRHTHVNKMLDVYLRPMKFGTRYACTSRPNALVATGRTSWAGVKLNQTNPWWPPPPEGYKYKTVEERAGTNMQNFPREEGIRDLIRPRPGHWWLSVDYDSLELRALAQVCLWVVGSSRLASAYQNNPDFDPHTELASALMGITPEAGLALKKAGDKQLKHHRSLAKVANFGFMGGLGPRRFVDYAKGSYGVIVSVDEAYALKEKWLQTWPEMGPYFEYASWVSETGSGITQFVSNRPRGRTGFSDTANSLVQGLAADGAKRALVALSMRCYCVPDSALYGSRIAAFIHDEKCLETPIESAHEAALETVSVMETEMGVVLPNIPVRATPALSTYWIKAAEPKYENGRLVPWA